MSLRTILDEAVKESGVPISDADFVRHYNGAVHRLAMLFDAAKVRATQSITSTAHDTEYNLTSGCLKVERVLDSNKNNFRYFTVRNNSKILFAYNDTYSVDGLFEPAAISSMSGTATINSVFNHAIELYVAANVLKKKDHERYKELIEEFSEEVELANKGIRGAVNPYKQIRKQLFR